MAQPGDDPAPVFSFMGNRAMHPRQVPCWITHTNERTHDIIRSGLDRSPTFTGVIEGSGHAIARASRTRFTASSDKTSHQIFLWEPEGLTTQEIYPAGVSTSLPFDIQLALIRLMVGLENAHILRPGYAIEYDYLIRASSGRRWKPHISTACLWRARQRDHWIRGGGVVVCSWRQRGAQGAGDGWCPRRDEAYPACWWMTDHERC